ncbi:mannan endo-1,4-beta-mannosidase-like [Haliotis cracherodii]|uniref:mannan endo-1,4-beta-mannosidase-like n=1 Tax=Haliotis cracherodii TaxID=6455 RepID=UPI0039EC5395
MRLAVVFWLCSGAVFCGPVDQHATSETKNLYYSLKTFARDPNKVLFGHQEDTWSGGEGGHAPYQTYSHNGSIQGWWFKTGQVDSHAQDELSDVRRVTGEYPAVIGFDFTNFEPDKLKIMTYLVKKAHEKGLVVTILQHNSNPVTGGSLRIEQDQGNVLHTIKRLLPGGSHNAVYRQNLDKIAGWVHSLKDKHGRLIPVIFRPLHEQNGGWFWWGLNNKAHNSPQDLKDLFKYIVTYLRDHKAVRNFLYCISPDKFTSKDDYLKIYPGDDYVDIVGTDFYYVDKWSTKDQFKRIITDIVEIAEARDKIPALTESGLFYNGINQQHQFWNDLVLDILKSTSTTRRLAYVLAWANKCWTDVCQLWVPYRGHPAAGSFKSHFYNDAMTVFGNGLHNIYG